MALQNALRGAFELRPSYANLKLLAGPARLTEVRAIHTAIHNNVVYPVLPMTSGAVRALPCRLSRQRSRVRVSSSPPFFPKDLGHFCRNHRGREKGALRALFVLFFRLWLCGRRFLSGKGDPPVCTGRKEQRHDCCLRRMFRRSNRLRVNVQR
jgi:hypothetical protein